MFSYYSYKNKNKSLYHLDTESKNIKLIEIE